MGLEGELDRFSRLVHARSGIESRGAAALELAPDAGSGRSTAWRMRAYRTLAPGLAREAGGAALRDAGAEAGSITHLVTVSCTGFGAPGIDVDLIESLGMPAGVERVHVGYMGCHGGLVGLRTAGALVRGAGVGARALVVCVEVCSLHAAATTARDRIVASALFGDGAGACVVGAAQPGRGGMLAIGPAASLLLPGTREAMGWTIGDRGFEMSLSERVPSLVARGLREWLVPWLTQRGIGSAGRGWGDVAWAVHPGGPRVLEAACEAIGLEGTSVDVSRAVLREHGNMSSSTIVFILDRLRRRGTSGPIVALGFGPGLTAEAMVFRGDGAASDG